MPDPLTCDPCGTPLLINISRLAGRCDDCRGKPVPRPGQRRTHDYRVVKRYAAVLGYELRRNQITRLWHWQVIASTALDWRGYGFRTQRHACEHFASDAHATDASFPLLAV